MRSLVSTLALVCLLALGRVSAQNSDAASDKIVVVGNPAQPVQWNHRSSIAEAIRNAQPNGTVLIPSTYAGTDCNPVSSCSPGSVIVVDWRTTPGSGTGSGTGTGSGNVDIPGFAGTPITYYPDGTAAHVNGTPAALLDAAGNAQLNSLQTPSTGGPGLISSDILSCGLSCFFPDGSFWGDTGVTMQTGSAPASPALGADLLYANSTTGLLSCLTSSGNNCLSPFLNPFDYAGSDICARIVAGMTANLTTGGTFWIPQGTYVCTTQLSVPFNSGPVQPSFRITGVGPSHDSSAAAGGTLVYGGTILDLQNNAATAKIDTRGSGYLEIDHVTLQDSASDCAAFLFTTNTVLHVHDVRFNGTSTACNDGIILGGTTTNVDATSTAAFQGYGTVVRDNFFQKIQRVVKLQTFANGIQIKDNTIWNGSAFATGGAIELNPNGAGQNITGNVITGNLIEVTGYLYGVWVHGTGGGGAGSANNFFAGNSCFDATGLTTACYKFEASSDFNYVVDSWHTASIAGITDVDGLNTYVTPGQTQTSVYPQLSKYTNAGTPIQIAKAGGNSSAYDILNTTTSDEIFQQVPSTAQPWQLELKSAGGTTENVFQFLRTAATSEYKIGKAADTTVFIEPGVGTSDLKLRSLGNSQVVWLCGGNSVCNTWVDTNGQLHNNTATGIAPLAFASNTPNATLSFSGVANTAQRSETGADANVLTFTPPAVVASYRIRFLLSVSAANAATLGWTATWTDASGNAQTPTNLALSQTGVAAPALTFTTSVAGDYYGEVNIDTNAAAANLVVKLTFSGTSFTGKASANIERLQ